MAHGIWWMASYPKSGNTWLRAVLSTLLSGQPVDINAMHLPGTTADDRSAFDDALGISSTHLSFDQETNLRPRVYEIWAEDAERPLYCKTHDAYHRTPAGEPLFPARATRGVVYMVRDPRAVAVSLAHYMGWPVDQAIAWMDDAAALSAGSTRRLSRHLRTLLWRWSEHVESWLAVPFAVHLLRYEDMLANPHDAFAAVATFLGLPCNSKTVAVAVAATTFSRLQAQERQDGFREKPRTAGAFFREGSADGWRRVLTPAQAARIVAAHAEVMRRLDYDVSLVPLTAERGAA